MNTDSLLIFRLRSAVAVSTLIGLSWIVGFFALGEASFVVNVIFAVCNSVQVYNRVVSSSLHAISGTF